MGFKIMLVKEDVALRTLIEEHLTKEGHTVSLFDSAEEAFIYFKPNYYDVIVTDYHLPDRTGIDLVKDIRKLDHNVGIVITTAEAQEAVSEQCDGLHVWSVVSDTSGFNVLVEKIAEAHEFAHITDVSLSDNLASEVSGMRKAILDVRSLLL